MLVRVKDSAALQQSYARENFAVLVNEKRKFPRNWAM